MKPTPADILVAIARAELGDWIDPSEVPLNWYCALYSPEGHVFNGNAHTAASAMAMAWLHAWAPDALINAYVEPGTDATVAEQKGLSSDCQTCPGISLSRSSRTDTPSRSEDCIATPCPVLEACEHRQPRHYDFA